ncbi:MAG: malonate transporter subunit MadM [Opitutus sp.]|nr:malonate transporter subunit MadM [Opitutus sp.]
MIDLLNQAFVKNGLLTGFVVVGGLMWFAYFLADRLTRGRIHGSAIAVFGGLVLAYVGGRLTGGKNGLADLPVFAGIGLLGGNMLRDFSIVATAYGASFDDLKKSGLPVVVALFAGVIVSFLCGAAVAVAFGYRDAVSIATIGAGAVTYIVGPVTGAALGATSEVIALSIAAGLVKAIIVMIATPLVAKVIGLDNPHTAMIYGGTVGTNSGVAAGLAATDPKLVPYGVMAATFYTGLGCLLAPSVLYLATRLIFPH